MIFYQNSTTWDKRDILCAGGLNELLEKQTPLTRRAFMANVCNDDLAEVEISLGFFPHHTLGHTMAGDKSVKYFRSKHHGEFCYGFTWRNISFIFKNDKELSQPASSTD